MEIEKEFGISIPDDQAEKDYNLGGQYHSAFKIK